MKVAIPQWQGRVSPVFDVAERVLIVDVEGGAVQARHEEFCGGAELHLRTKRLAEWGVDVLICGAISQALEFALCDTGIEVIPLRCGAVEDILAAYIGGRLAGKTFTMPGCRESRRRKRPVPHAGTASSERRDTDDD
jgi:predicted Fe-Mo cluster-binding NifX family protein